MIKCLPEEVRGKLRSGVAVPSLQQCLEELILNSIDAGATCVGVRMDLQALKVQVIDNGAGMEAEDLGRAGNRYHTSKCGSFEDLDNLRWYGFRGEALASIVSLATLVEISSRTRSSAKTHVKVFKSGRGLEVFEAETSRPSAGTTVVICNFFHNMPVRRRRVDAVLEGERIRHRVEAISLMHPSVSFTLKNDCTAAMMVQLPKARSTHHRFAQIHGPGRAQKLGEVAYTQGVFEVTGHIGREGHYNNSLQFLYVNDRLLLRTRVHQLLSFLLRRLTASSQKSDSPDGQPTIRSPKHKRSQEQHGVYVINIRCPYSEYDICLEPAKTLIEFRDWGGVLFCVEEAVKAFMRRENLVAVLSQDDLDCVSPELFGVDGTGREESGGGAARGASTLDCSVGMKLASESVHRKRRNDCDCEEEPGAMECNVDEAEKIISNDLEEECSKETQQDLADCNTTDEEEPTCVKAEESSQILCLSNSDRQLQSEKTQSPVKGEIQCNSNMTLPASPSRQIQPDSNSIEQLLPKCQGAEGHKQPLIGKRKISLSDPFIHQSLQTHNPSQINKSLFQQQRSIASKCKISLALCKDFAPIVPSKIPRTASCQRLSLSQEAGSLDKFRRVFGKSHEMKLPSPETHLHDSARLTQTNSLILNPQKLLPCQKDQRDGDVTQTQRNKTQSGCQSPPALPVFTKIKPVSAQNKGKKSLAAKLCRLKQHRTEGSGVSLNFSGTTPLDNTCLHSGNDGQDSNNNESPCDTAPHPEPASGCNMNPRVDEGEKEAMSGDWLHHYDTSVGKTVYVNRVTGLSKYEDPAIEETQARCMSDVTNMAVSVITETGMEYRCYPFQVDLVLPFLPKSRTERVISSGLGNRDDSGESSNSLSSLYSKWNNPVFVRPPMVGVDISSGQADGLAVKIHNILFPYRFSKAMIHSMKVIHQVDKKFLACLINTREEEPAAHTETEGNLLVLVDQHAAHERVRLENLVADSYEDDPDVSGERRLCSSTILPPLEISVTEEELRLLRVSSKGAAYISDLGSCAESLPYLDKMVMVSPLPNSEFCELRYHAALRLPLFDSVAIKQTAQPPTAVSCQAHLRTLGLEVKFSQEPDPQVFVGKVPLCFMEKERNEVKRGRPSVIKPIVEEYLREQIELLRSAGRVRGTLPLTVLKVLASLACHGAIKFNDSLSRDECHSLVASLSSCQLPFQCAHGRPSIAPLVDMLHLDKDQKELQKPNLQKLRRMHKAWELYGDK